MRNGLLSSYHTRISWKSNFWLTFNKWEEWDKEINCDKLTRICFSSALAPQTTVYTIVFHVYVLILSILSSEITFTFFFIWMFKRIGTELIKKIFKIIQIAIREGEIQDLLICVSSAWRIVLIFNFLNPFEFDRRSFDRATSQKVQNVIFMYIKYVVGRCRMCLCLDEKRERIRPFICV